jgi:hypothetical protein
MALGLICGRLEDAGGEEGEEGQTYGADIAGFGDD